MGADAGLQLSVVVATLKKWSGIKEYLTPLLIQAEELGVEVIVADGNGHALPDTAMANVVWLREVGSSVYRLRALGVQKARGQIIAFTEDHCKVSPDWCEKIIIAHRQHGDIEVISGVIENGSTKSLLDWVHFLMAKGPFMSPVTPGESYLISGEPNISFKKHIVPNDISEIGLPFYQSIPRRGLKTRIHDDIVVRHFQSLRFAGTCRAHYHNGRTIAGLRLPDLTMSKRLLRLASCAILPGFLTLTTCATVLRKRRKRTTILIGLPLLLSLTLCHSTGEFFGYLFGAGESPRMIN